MVATSSRMIWAFAREGGLPFSRYLSQVSEVTIINTGLCHLTFSLLYD